jgi:hypothetical protein
VRLDEPSAVALPFAVNQSLVSGQSPSDVTFTTVGERRLSGFPVASNSTGMIHSEQMFDLGGSIAWDASASEPTVENGTSLALSGAAVVRRRIDGEGSAIDESAWLGDLAPGERATVRFAAHDAAQWLGAREADPLSTKMPLEGALSLRRLIDCAEDHAALEPGEVRLVAWHDGGLDGIEVRPRAKQARRAALVVARLQFGAGAPPRADANLPARAASPNDEPFEPSTP